jgi:hypothetical protein
MKYMNSISSCSQDNVFFYWDGPISDTRLKILKDCVYSTRVLNLSKKIFVISNTLTQQQFDSKYDICVLKWDATYFNGLPIPPEKYTTYMKAQPRAFSDLFRIVLLYNFGGSYIDTDDLAIKPISDTKNIICRSYDPHTCFYNKIKDNECIEGKYREIAGYNSIHMFPRNDCWLNWDKHHPFLYGLLMDTEFLEYDNVIHICGKFSWQSLTLKHCKQNIDTIGVNWTYGLTLLYLYEDFISCSSKWDRGKMGGEMIDIWNTIQHDTSQEWGKWRVTKEEALKFYTIVCNTYPYVSHLWLHSKDNKKEWLIEELVEGEIYSVSTWIYDFIRRKIRMYGTTKNAAANGAAPSLPSVSESLASALRDSQSPSVHPPASPSLPV